MPASLFGEMDHHGSIGSNGGGGGPTVLEDQRALQLALELSMLGLGTEPVQMPGENPGQVMPTDSSLFAATTVDEIRNMIPRKSQNMTECVPVPSSEHVAEIVGRQGCKIKALRAKTNTYIKTPVRGEEPVFVVTGRKEDVALAKREILSAADHFSQIRATRKGGSNGGPGCPPAPVPGQVTIQVRVPYRVVGLVVGPKGATIKRIQQQTQTYIVTPSRDNDPVFEVTGLPDNVNEARREIEAHIAIRTGNMATENGAPNDEIQTAEMLASFYKNAFNGLLCNNLLDLGAITSFGSSLSNPLGLGAIANNVSANAGSVGSSSSGGGSLSSLSSLNGFSGSNNQNANSNVTNNNPNGFLMPGAIGDLDLSFLESAAQNGIGSSSNGSEDSYLFGRRPNSIGGSQTKLTDLFTNNGTNASVSVSNSLWGSFDRDEGLGDSPTLESNNGTSMWGDLNKMRPNQSGSPPELNHNQGNGNNTHESHTNARRMSSDPILGFLPSVASSTGSASISGPSSPTQLVD